MCGKCRSLYNSPTSKVCSRRVTYAYNTTHTSDKHLLFIVIVLICASGTQCVSARHVEHNAHTRKRERAARCDSAHVGTPTRPTQAPKPQLAFRRKTSYTGITPHPPTSRHYRWLPHTRDHVTKRGGFGSGSLGTNRESFYHALANRSHDHHD